MAALDVAKIPRCDPARFTRIEAGVLARGWPRPLLVVAGLGEPALLLGRHQRAASAADVARARSRGLAVVRRAGGGRGAIVGDGVVGVFLYAPETDPLAPGCPPDRRLPRHLRALLAGLRACGARGAAWLGRDVVSADARSLALVSQEATPAGALAIEALVAVERPIAVPHPLTRYPAARDPRTAGPRPVTLVELRGAPLDLDALALALEGAHAAAHDREPARAAGVLPEAALPPVEEDEAGLVAGGLVDAPIGFVEALAAPAPPVLSGVRLRGDLLAPAFALEGLEAGLEGAPADRAEIARRVSAAFGRPHAFLHGATEAALVDAIAAAGRAP